MEIYSGDPCVGIVILSTSIKSPGNGCIYRRNPVHLQKSWTAPFGQRSPRLQGGLQMSQTIREELPKALIQREHVLGK